MCFVKCKNNRNGQNKRGKHTFMIPTIICSDLILYFSTVFPSDSNVSVGGMRFHWSQLCMCVLGGSHEAREGLEELT